MANLGTVLFHPTYTTWIHYSWGGREEGRRGGKSDAGFGQLLVVVIGFSFWKVKNVANFLFEEDGSWR